MTPHAGLRPLARTNIVVNGRFRTQRITGVQRYGHEIANRLAGEVEVLAPRSRKGAVGHLWEQTMLPLACGGRLLWNPNACGPLGYSRQVVTFHDLFPVEHPEWYSAAYARWYGIVMRQLAQRATHLIAVSEYTKSRLVARFGRDPEEITVIPNGCHVHGPASEGAVHAAGQALKLPTRRYVLSLSSIELRKNLRCVLAAWAAIYAQLPEDVWLVLAGPKADETVYGDQGLSTALPRVLYTGYVPEEHLQGLYTGATLFVFPSLAEGFGLPLLEAMSCGVRCVASRTSSLPEVGGDVVEYIDPLEPGELAAAMLSRLMKDGPAVPYTPAIERAQKFSWGTAAARTRDVLAAALAASPIHHPHAARLTPAPERMTAQ